MNEKMTFETLPLADLKLKLNRTQVVQNCQKPMVLVVDDEIVIADTLAAILRTSGMDAFSAYSGEEALTVAEEIEPDLLLTDVMMPGMDGIELAMGLQRKFPDCRVLLFSGQASTASLLEKARSAGKEYSLLQKPLHPKDLLARISVALASAVSV